MEMGQTPSTHLYQTDVDDEFLALCRERRAIAWDIETSGLDWGTDRIATCQIAAGGTVALVQLGGEARPERLVSLLEDEAVLKVFHHAPFDLRFMCYKWSTTPTAVACTKVASKILSPHLDKAQHSLKPTLARRLGIQISKEQQRSDWLTDELSDAQLEYAAADVRYLLLLLEDELQEARQRGVEHLVQRSFDYLPVRAALDILGVGDVYAY